MPKISAALDASLANLASFYGLRFTARQLYYEVCRTLKAPKGLDAAAAAATFAAASLAGFGFALGKKRAAAIGVFAAAALLCGGLYALRQTAHTLRPPVSFGDFRRALDAALQNRARPFGLLPEENDAEKTDALEFDSTDLPADLTHYGLPRLLICQSAEIARMLRANNFHLETACAILSYEKAAPLAQTFRKMLLRAENARVYFLHDASLAAQSLIVNLRQRFVLPETIRLQILGLRPAHAAQLHLFATCAKHRASSEIEVQSFLSEAEKRWLAANNQAEVQAIHPARLLRVLRKLVLNLPDAPPTWKLALPPRELGFM